MTLAARVANALSFSHLAGLRRAAKPKSEEKDKDTDKDEDKERAEGEDKDDQEDREDQNREDGDARRAEEGGDGNESEKDPEEDDSGKGKKGRKAKKGSKADDSGESEDQADDEDDSEEEMRGNSSAAKARRRERARCAAIFGSRYAANNVALAARLAFNTTLSREDAIAVLKDTPACAPQGSERRSRNPHLDGGSEPSGGSSQAVEASWDRAFAKTGAQPKGK